MGIPHRRRTGHLRLVAPCAPMEPTVGALIELAPDQVLVGTLLGRPYVRTVTSPAGRTPQIPALRAGMNLHVLADARLVVVDGDERWLRDVMALHRAGGVEAWVVAVARRAESDATTELRVRRQRPTTAAEGVALADRPLHDLDALLGPAPEHGPPPLRVLPPPFRR